MVVASRQNENDEIIINDMFLLFPILSILSFYTFSIVALIILNTIFEEYVFLKIVISAVVVVQAFFVFRFKKDNIYVLTRMGFRPLIRKSKFTITPNQITVDFHDSDSFCIEWSEFDSIEIKIAKRTNPLIIRLLKVYATELSIKFFETNRYGLLKMNKMLKLNNRRFRKSILHKISKLLMKYTEHHNKEIIK